MTQVDTTISLKGTNHVSIPSVGLGVFQAAPKDTVQAVTWALEAGYRHIDTAALYNNEKEVGIAIKNSHIPRQDIFVTTKVWNTDQGYESTLVAFERSLKNLGLDYIDLYLIHAPVVGKRADTWKALEHLHSSGKVRAIGVSNYGVHHLEEMKQYAKTMPLVNQIEVHPFFQRTDIVNYCKQNHIVVQAYSPLTRGLKLDDPVLVRIGQKYNKTSAQVLIRWGLQHGYVSLPKSVQKQRIEANFQVFDFELDESDMNELNHLESGSGVAWDPTAWK